MTSCGPGTAHGGPPRRPRGSTLWRPGPRAGRPLEPFRRACAQGLSRPQANRMNGFLPPPSTLRFASNPVQGRRSTASGRTAIEARSSFRRTWRVPPTVKIAEYGRRQPMFGFSRPADAPASAPRDGRPIAHARPPSSDVKERRRTLHSGDVSRRMHDCVIDGGSHAAIVALAGGWLHGWSWLDPVMGIVGAGRLPRRGRRAQAVAGRVGVSDAACRRRGVEGHRGNRVFSLGAGVAHVGDQHAAVGWPRKSPRITCR